MKHLASIILLSLCPFINHEKLVFPTPPKTPHLLFYIQRSNNIHTVIYDANIDLKTGKWNNQEPLKVYWIRYADKGQIQPLKLIEKKLAYGVETKLTKNGFDVAIVAFRKRKIQVFLDKNQPIATMKIGEHESKIKKIFVQLYDNNALIPRVKFIELYGTNILTRQETFERFEP